MAAPSKESPFATVILQHDLPDGTTHFDWLLAVDAESKNPLISFRCTTRPDQINEVKWFDLEKRPDHRPEYLTLEGDIEGGRGTVTRLASGSIFFWKEIESGWNMMVDWDTGGINEFVVTTTHGAIAMRRVFEDQSQETPPPPPKVDGDVPIETSDVPGGLERKITAFGSDKKQESNWARIPHATGTGASHVKTFHSKLTDDALGYIDTQINEWLDENPTYEVKFVSTTIGTFTGKTKEPHLICQVWV